MDAEARILLTGDGKDIEDMIIWIVGADGQWYVADHQQLGPFHTRMELALRIARAVIRAWGDQVAETTG